jgi:hypothetical protein
MRYQVSSFGGVLIDMSCRLSFGLDLDRRHSTDNGIDSHSSTSRSPSISSRVGNLLTLHATTVADYMSNLKER